MQHSLTAAALPLARPHRPAAIACRLLARNLVLLLALFIHPAAVAAAQDAGRSPAPSLSTADVAARATPATVTILAIDATGDTLAQGSGFLIQASGVLVTNFHVLAGASRAVVILATKERFDRVHVLDADSALDLALLKIPGAGLAVLPTRTTTPRVGEKVIAIGSPLGLAQTVSEGIVSASRLVRGHELVQITAPISPGSSGGAVLDAEGRVFAISTSRLVRGEALNFAVPVRYALGLLGDAPHEVTVASVFAHVRAPEAPAAETPATDASTTTTTSSDRGNQRATTPRTSIEGTYGVGQTVYDSTGAEIAAEVGYLFATNRMGWLVLARINADSTLGPTHCYPVTRWAGAANGDVVLVAGGVTYDGYQTADSGFIAAGAIQHRGVPQPVKLGAVPTALPLSRSDGLYTVHIRTLWTSTDGVTNYEAPVDWDGDLAVAFARDTAYVALYMTNTQGGATGLQGHAPLVNHTAFDLVGNAGAHLHGEFVNGVLEAHWEDPRNGGTFAGDLEAQRR